MWIKDLPPNYLQCYSGPLNLNGLWRDGKVYVMDNHRAAAWCWLHSCDFNESYNFLHIDQHSDLLLDGNKDNWETYQRVIDNPKISLNEYLLLQHNDSQNALAFRWDNYIRPIHKYLSNWFTYSFFAYFQAYDIYEHERMIASASNYYKGFSGTAIKLTPEELLILLEQIPTAPLNSWIFNLDIDYFYSRETIKMGDSFIDKIACLLNDCLPQMKVLTIALSPSCCNGNSSIISGWHNSLHAFEIFKRRLSCLEKCNFPL